MVSGVGSGVGSGAVPTMVPGGSEDLGADCVRCRGSGVVPTMVPGGSEDLGADCGLVPVVPEIPAWCFRCDSGMVFTGLIIHCLA